MLEGDNLPSLNFKPFHVIIFWKVVSHIIFRKCIIIYYYHYYHPLAMLLLQQPVASRNFAPTIDHTYIYI